MTTPPITPGTPAPAPAESGARRPLRPLASLRAHLVLAVAVTAVIALLGATFAWTRGKAVYAVEAALRVSPTFAKVLRDDPELQFGSNAQYRQFVQQQVVDLASFEVARAALDRLGANRSLWQRPGESDQRAAERLMAAIRVRAIPDTYLVTVGIEGDRAKGLAEIVNTVVEAYLARQGGEDVYAYDARMTSLRERRAELVQEVAEKSARQTAIAQQLGITSFEDKFPNPFDRELVDTMERAALARQRRMDAEAKLAALAARSGDPDPAEIEFRAQDLARSDRNLGDLRTALEQRRAPLLLQMTGLGPEHPRRLAAQRELARIDREIAEAEARTIEKLRTILIAERRAKVAEELGQAHAEVAQARASDSLLSRELGRMQERVGAFSERYGEGRALVAEIDRGRRQIVAIDDRLDFLILETQAPGFVRLASAARTPEIPISGGRSRLLVLVLVAAIGAGLVAPVAFDFLDPRVRGPEDIERAVGFPAMGWLLDAADDGARPAAADRLRRLMLTIDRERRAHGSRRVLLTGVSAGMHTTSLANDLARDALSLGLRVITVRAVGLPQDAAPIGEPSPTWDLDALIVRGNAHSPDSLSLVGPGDRLSPGEPDRLRSILDKLDGPYDLVFVSAPPVLESADTELLVGLAGATLLVVPAGTVTAGRVKRAARALERLSPPVVGFVLTGVRLARRGNRTRRGASRL